MLHIYLPQRVLLSFTVLQTAGTVRLKNLPRCPEKPYYMRVERRIWCNFVFGKTTLFAWKK